MGTLDQSINYLCFAFRLYRLSDCELNGEDEMGFFPLWIWLIIALVFLLIVVFITVCICKRKPGKFKPNQEKDAETEIEAQKMAKEIEKEILIDKPDNQTPKVHEDPENTTLPIITIPVSVILPPSSVSGSTRELSSSSSEAFVRIAVQ